MELKVKQLTDQIEHMKSQQESEKKKADEYKTFLENKTLTFK